MGVAEAGRGERGNTSGCVGGQEKLSLSWRRSLSFRKNQAPSEERTPGTASRRARAGLWVQPALTPGEAILKLVVFPGSFGAKRRIFQEEERI
jgi:hypothetical protein